MRINPDKQFAERECPSCATHVPANNNRCPICKYEFPQSPAWKKPLLAIVAILLILALLRWLL